MRRWVEGIKATQALRLSFGQDENVANLVKVDFLVDWDWEEVFFYDYFVLGHLNRGVFVENKILVILHLGEFPMKYKNNIADAKACSRLKIQRSLRRLLIKEANRTRKKYKSTRVTQFLSACFKQAKHRISPIFNCLCLQQKMHSFPFPDFPLTLFSLKLRREILLLIVFIFGFSELFDVAFGVGVFEVFVLSELILMFFLVLYWSRLFLGAQFGVRDWVVLLPVLEVGFLHLLGALGSDR